MRVTSGFTRDGAVEEKKLGEESTAGTARGPVATLRRIAFLMERQREETRRIEAFRKAARTILPLPEDEVRRRAADGTLTELTGIGPSTAAVITDACNGVVPERLVRLEATAGPAGAWRGGAARPAAGRPALPLRLVRRRLAAGGDGDDGHGAGPRLPRAHRPQPTAAGGQRAQRRAADAPARGRGRRQRAPRRVVHPAEGDRGGHPRRRVARPDPGDAGPARRPRRVACTPSSRWTPPR